MNQSLALSISKHSSVPYTTSTGSEELYSSRPQPFWYQGSLQWKTIFAWTRVTGRGGWLGDASSTLYLLCTLFLLLLYQFHLRSSGIRSQRLETPALRDWLCKNVIELPMFHQQLRWDAPGWENGALSYIPKWMRHAGSVCLTLCNPMDCSPPGSSVHGIFQARILERVAILFSRESSPPQERTHISWVCCISRQILYHSAT